jgi:hypothetical protein
LVTIWYGRACSPQASCNHLRQGCTFLSTCNLHFNNVALLVLTEHLVSETLRDKWKLAPLQDTSENHRITPPGWHMQQKSLLPSSTHARARAHTHTHTHIHKAVRNAAQYLCCH